MRNPSTIALRDHPVLLGLVFGVGLLAAACDGSTGGAAASGSGGFAAGGQGATNAGGGGGESTGSGGGSGTGGAAGSGGRGASGGATSSGGSDAGSSDARKDAAAEGPGSPDLAGIDVRPAADQASADDGLARPDATAPDRPVPPTDAVSPRPDVADDAAPTSPAGIFVAPTGLDSNAGTLEAPYKTLGQALSVAKAGSQIWLRGGTFAQTSTIKLQVSGTAGNLLKIWAYEDEIPVFDFTGQTSSDGLSIDGNYIHLKGVEVAHSFHNGIRISGANNIVELCKIHDNNNSGMLIRGTGASNNLVLNCDAYLNYDAPVGGNADGFSAKWELGSGNVFRGCRSWNNSDDGWDLWMADHSVVLDHCWAFNNGVNSWGSASFAGNGNGIKLGGNQVATPNTVTNCLAFGNTGNGGKGFDENNNLAGQTLYNCTAFGNQNGNFVFTNSVTTGAHVFANCISHNGKVNITSGTQKNNSWQNGLQVTDADFESVSPAQAQGARAPDGSLPTIPLLHLAAGSDLINAGVDVGLPYSGSAPDLGCFETP